MTEEKKRILIVDDQEEIQELVSDMITMSLIDEIVVMDTQNVESAQEIIKEYGYKINLVILDMDIPGKNGFIFCKEVREMSKIPFIFMSGNSVSCQKARRMGIVFEKPFSYQELSEIIKGILIIGKTLA